MMLRNQSAPNAQPEKSSTLSLAAQSRLTNRRNVRRVDYKEAAITSTFNNSAVAMPASSSPLDKSAPNEFAIPANPLIERGLEVIQSPGLQR